MAASLLSMAPSFQMNPPKVSVIPPISYKNELNIPSSLKNGDLVFLDIGRMVFSTERYQASSSRVVKMNLASGHAATASSKMKGVMSVIA